MSKQHVVEFMNKANSDKTLMEKIRVIPTSDQKAAVTALVGLARESGFDFTDDEYREVWHKTHDDKGNKKLSDDELAQVAGGSCTTDGICPADFTCPSHQPGCPTYWCDIVCYVMGQQSGQKS